MGFRKPQTIKRETAGSYVNGVWVPGSTSTITIQASVQSATGEDQVTLPEGKRLSDIVKMYTDTLLNVVGETVGQQPDKLLWRGHEYEIIQLDERSMDVINHRKYFCSKVTQ